MSTPPNAVTARSTMALTSAFFDTSTVQWSAALRNVARPLSIDIGDDDVCAFFGEKFADRSAEA
jgi:hypothetical protein